MGGLPDVLFVIDVGHEKIAVQEASKLRIPIIGIVDTNNVPDKIDYMIPGNDDAMRAIKLYLDLAVKTINAAKVSGGFVTSESNDTDEFIEVSETALPEIDFTQLGIENPVEE